MHLRRLIYRSFDQGLFFVTRRFVCAAAPSGRRRFCRLPPEGIRYRLDGFVRCLLSVGSRRAHVYVDAHQGMQRGTWSAAQDPSLSLPWSAYCCAEWCLIRLLSSGPGEEREREVFCCCCSLLQRTCMPAHQNRRGLDVLLLTHSQEPNIVAPP